MRERVIILDCSLKTSNIKNQTVTKYVHLSLTSVSPKFPLESVTLAISSRPFLR